MLFYISYPVLTPALFFIHILQVIGEIWGNPLSFTLICVSLTAILTRLAFLFDLLFINFCLIQRHRTLTVVSLFCFIASHVLLAGGFLEARTLVALYDVDDKFTLDKLPYCRRETRWFGGGGFNFIFFWTTFLRETVQKPKYERVRGFKRKSGNGSPPRRNSPARSSSRPLPPSLIPPTNDDPKVYSIQYELTIILLRVLFQRTRRRPMACDDTAGGLELTLLSTSSSSRDLFSYTPDIYDFSPSDVARIWLDDYETNKKHLVCPQHMPIQMANLAHMLDLFSIQDKLRSKYIAAEEIEANEFAATWTTLGRCFLSDILLAVLKGYLILEGTSVLVSASFSVTAIAAGAACIYNVGDASLWGELFSAID